ncbi:MAG TPA: UDP-N-acetylglucosamine--N-acetylmuramyl-(pentapeptide) pyrophosphoryl-undecaprenol N-acetylglucosamine transferase, partial [Burkholderiales bacterium]
MAGGTGGHVFPGLAVAEEMRGRGWNVVWMGARAGLEARLVPARGYPVEWIRAAALRGKGLAAKLLLPLRLLVGFWQSARAILRIRPAVVLSMGGYVAFPGGMMASLLARPLAVHEQNAIAGLANRVLAGVADKTMVAFPGALAGSEWTGNPVRADIAGIAEPGARYGGRTGPLRLLVVGGSLGAQALNEVIPKALALLSEDVRPSVLHQAGEKNLAELKSNYQSCGIHGELGAFIEDMARA